MNLYFGVGFHIIYIQGIVSCPTPLKYIVLSQIPFPTQTGWESESSIGLETVSWLFSSIQQASIYIQIPLPREQKSFPNGH